MALLDARHILTFENKDILPKGLTEGAYALAFMKEFGLKSLQESLAYRSPHVTLPLVISRALFLDKSTHELKANKNGRGPYLRLLARTIKNPYEIWQTEVEINGKRRSVLRFIRLFQGEGKSVGGFGVFSLYRNKEWSGSTLFNPGEEKRETMLNYLEKQRNGVLIYREK